MHYGTQAISPFFSGVLSGMAEDAIMGLEVRVGVVFLVVVFMVVFLVTVVRLPMRRSARLRLRHLASRVAPVYIMRRSPSDLSLPVARIRELVGWVPLSAFPARGSPER